MTYKSAALQVWNLATLVLCLSTIVPEAHGVSVQINPHFGSGNISDGSQVKSAAGLKAAMTHEFLIGGTQIGLGPRLEIGNYYVHTNQSVDNRSLVSTHDNRFLAAGLQASVPFSNSALRKDVYMAVVGGRGMSKISQDENGDSYFAQKFYNKIQGSHIGMEIGTNLQVKNDIAFNVAVIGMRYRANADQRGLSGEVSTTSGVFGLTESNSEDRLPDEFTTQTYGATFGIRILM